MRAGTLLLLLALVFRGVGAAAGPPIVAAASDLQFALADVVAAFREQTGHEVKTVFGSSGHLFRQIEQGAPFELFFSADEDYVRRLAQGGRTVDAGAVYAIGRIGLFVPHGSTLKADGRLDDLRRALDEGRVTKFAIANPDHAPYGIRAREALQHAGLWRRLEPRLVFGENVSQAAQFAATGGAQGGIIAYSLAKAPPVAALGRFALIPEDWHQPLRQRVVLLRGAGDVAAAFYRFVQGANARAVFRAFGFETPEPLRPGRAPGGR
ncbi:MAG: molybdate ABC transporter substrate-binding protein [Acidobacteriota bacterium]